MQEKRASKHKRNSVFNVDPDNLGSQEKKDMNQTWNSNLGAKIRPQIDPIETLGVDKQADIKLRRAIVMSILVSIMDIISQTFNYESSQFSSQGNTLHNLHNFKSKIQQMLIRAQFLFETTSYKQSGSHGITILLRKAFDNNDINAEESYSNFKSAQLSSQSSYHQSTNTMLLTSGPQISQLGTQMPQIQQSQQPNEQTYESGSA